MLCGANRSVKENMRQQQQLYKIFMGLSKQLREVSLFLAIDLKFTTHSLPFELKSISNSPPLSLPELEWRYENRTVYRACLCGN